MGKGEHSFFSIPFNTSNFHSPKNWEEWEGMKLNLMNFFTKTFKISLYIQPFILKYSPIVILL